MNDYKTYVHFQFWKEPGVLNRRPEPQGQLFEESSQALLQYSRGYVTDSHQEHRATSIHISVF